MPRCSSRRRPGPPPLPSSHYHRRREPVPPLSPSPLGVLSMFTGEIDVVPVGCSLLAVYAMSWRD